MPQAEYPTCLDGTCKNPATWCGFCLKDRISEDLKMQRISIAGFLAQYESIPNEAIEQIISGEFYTSTAIRG